jgi:hypothetical protein
MTTSRMIGSAGLILLFLGLGVMVYPTWHTEVTKAGPVIECVAYCAFISAGFLGSKKWLLLLLLSPISAYIWLLAQGH